MRAPCLALACLPAVVAVACGDDASVPLDAGTDAAPCCDGDTSDADTVPVPPVIGTVPESERFTLAGLSGPAHVVYTENHVPHIYAESREDLARVTGFVMARDRFVMMDLTRRLAMGTLSALLGQDALESDVESRATGMRHVAEATLARFTAEQLAWADAFAAGVNAYIEVARGRRAYWPDEYELAAPFVAGTANAAEMMEPFGREDVAAIAAVLTYELGYETNDVDRETAAQAIDALYVDAPLSDLRTAGAWDVYSRVTAPNGYATGSVWGLETATTATAGEPPSVVELPGRRADLRYRPRLPSEMLRRLSRALSRLARRFHRDESGFGSNAWAVGGALTNDGAAILAGDGHLGGTVPTLFYRIGYDTELLGDGDTRQVGLSFPGVPLMALGTNGHVAWAQTQFFGDITDWYREEILLDADGMPAASRFGGEDRPLVRVDEAYDVADVPAFDSVGRTETWARFETFDGRFITAIEGRSAVPGEPLGPGESLLRLMGGDVVPGDTDGDGIVTAISFDYTGLEGPNFTLTLDRWGHAANVQEMLDTEDALVAYSQNIIAADSAGSVMFTPYQAMPCRTHLSREADGSWSPGADPGRLIDGTRFGAFSLPLTPDGRVDESAAGSDPSRCVVPAAEYPGVLDPSDGFVVSANNDPGNMAMDNDLTNDPWYIGGPWHEDFRATRLDSRIRAEAGSIDEASMARLQADDRDALAPLLVPLLLDAIDAARAAAAGTPTPGTAEARMAARFSAAQADFEQFEQRMTAWQDAGFPTPSGVETFYHTPAAGEGAHAVATMLFQAWFGPLLGKIFDDERFPRGIYAPTSAGGRLRVLTRLIAGRGAGNPEGLVSWNPATEESVFFDVLDTPEVETSAEIAILSIDDALAFLRSEPAGPGQGGFGNDDWDSWLWGLRHHTRFESLLGEFLAGDDTFGSLVESLSITPETLPLMDELPETDLRATLPGFPRKGGQLSVDAANPGFSGTRFTFSSIPVFRMVVSLRDAETTGRNMLPQGQSALTGSPYFADQSAAWLANETTPMRLTPESVVEGAIERETFVP